MKKEIINKNKKTAANQAQFMTTFLAEKGYFTFNILAYVDNQLTENR